MNIFFAVVILLFLPISSYSKDIEVIQGMSIKDAVINAQENDRIIVKGGVYNETGIVIDKKIELIGIDFPVIDAGSTDQVITLKANGAMIHGFVIKNSGFSNLKDLAGIKIDNASDCIVSGNKLEYNFFAIYLAGANRCIVTANEVISNAVSETSSGNGIHLWKCDSILIENNTVRGHRDGIYFEFATNCVIRGNTSIDNIRYGLHFMFSNNDIYENNTFFSNGAGVAVMYTKNVTMLNNTFEDNWGSNSYGLLLKEITHSTIQGNVFRRNTVGIYAEGGVDIVIEKNTFESNGWAAKILGNCYDNTITLNNFIGNSFDVASNSSQLTNKFFNNFWDKYKGYDLDRDGKGDVPYRPTSLFALIVEKSPGSIILLRSLIVDVMDLAEKVMPVFVPEILVDTAPLMDKYQ